MLEEGEGAEDVLLHPLAALRRAANPEQQPADVVATAATVRVEATAEVPMVKGCPLTGI
jgi:hypothetical protein